MELAEGEAVRHNRLPLRLSAGQDVRSVEQLLVAQTADRAAFAVGAQDTLAECLLMDALPGQPRNVRPAPLLSGFTDSELIRRRLSTQRSHTDIVDLHGEDEALRIVADH